MLLGSACTLPFHRAELASPCERETPAETTEPVFAFARQLLTDTAWAELRQELHLPDGASEVTWVGDPRTCRQLAAALARSNGRPPDYGLALAAVRIGEFYVVRRGPGSEWLIGADFRVKTVFVSQ